MQSNSEYSLFAWGRNYERPIQLRKQVLFAAAGENHFIVGTSNGQCYGAGSNKFGQLGLRECILFKEQQRIFENFKIKSVFCGAEHTFVITEKYEVYSCGLNIKGQLGHSLFQNSSQLKMVPSLIPFGPKNQKSLNPANSKPPKPLILSILEKFDLQVKLDESNESIILLGAEEFIEKISCGALFTIALSNKGRLFGCGFQGVNSVNSHDDQMDNSKFKIIEIDQKIAKIHSSLSGTAAISKEGFAYVWGRFGKLNYNTPKQITVESITKEQYKFYDCKVGDEFALFLSTKGEVFAMGENIDNQLGTESYLLTYQQKIDRVPNCPISIEIFVGRNNAFAVDAETRQIYGWGSNKYGQTFPMDAVQTILGITNSKIRLQEGDKLVASSYFTLLISKHIISFIHLQKKKEGGKEKAEETIAMSEYRKLLNQYQILKGLNLTLIEKHHTTKRESRETQTISKFDISGVTQFRKFNQNIEIPWKEIQLEAKINEGGYGHIYRAKWREIQVVVKKFKIENGDVSLRDFLSQCNAMEAVRHPNIVMFLGAVTTNPHYSIILQYCPNSSLWSYIQNKENAINWEDRRRFSIQIAQGVHYLHSCSPPILHRDLKSLNIFLDAALRIKIGDFGWTKTLQEYMTNKIGTYQWMAPEVIGSKPYTEKADVFSYSIIMWQIASREPPYKNINGVKVSEQVLHKQLRPTIPAKVPENYAKLMKKCWDNDPNKRPSFRQIIRELEVMKLQK